MSIIPSGVYPHELKLNPFASLFNDDEEILSGLYCRSLYEKYIDVLTILTGKFYNFIWDPDMFIYISSLKQYRHENTPVPQLGLFDYVTLGTTMTLPFLGLKMGELANKHKSRVEKGIQQRDFFYYSVFVLTSTFQALFAYPMIGIDWFLRLVFGFIGLLIATPFIIGIHLYVNYIFRDVTRIMKSKEFNVFVDNLFLEGLYVENFFDSFADNINLRMLRGKSELYEMFFSLPGRKYKIGFEFGNSDKKERQIYIASPKDACHVKKLAKANICGIGNLIKKNPMLEKHVNDVESGQAYGVKQAREYWFVYLQMMRKLPFELASKVMEYVIPKFIVYTNVTFYGHTENHISFNFFFKKIKNINQNSNPTVTPSNDTATAFSV